LHYLKNYPIRSAAPVNAEEGFLVRQTTATTTTRNPASVFLKKERKAIKKHTWEIVDSQTKKLKRRQETLETNKEEITKNLNGTIRMIH
jgi:hypothetical protein